MGRAKVDDQLMLVDPQNGPLPELEYMMIAEPHFSVPFESIRAVESKRLPIPGLKTREDALKDKFFSQKNVFCVKVRFEEDADIADKWMVLTGRNTVEELADYVHSELQAIAGVGVHIYFHGKLVPYDTQLLKLYKQSVSSDGVLEVSCVLAEGEAVN